MGKVRRLQLPARDGQEGGVIPSADVATFLAALDQKHVKQQGKGWLARCPAHDDTHQSLTVNEGADGKLLARCHAGCAFTDIISASGVPQKGKARPHPLAIVRDKPGIIAEYDYTDENDTLLSQTTRTDDKQFRQRRPNGRGGWINNLDGARRVLYRLSRVIEAAAEGRRIYVVEGEKDADALAALGLTATTNQGGAAAPWLPEYSEALAGADVIVLPDNDAPGENHARTIAQALHATGTPVRICRLPDLPQKGDVSDWLNAGGTFAGLEELANTAPMWTPSAEADPTSPAAPRFRLYTVADLAQIPEPIPLVEGLLHRDTLAMIVAKYASYKSFVALDLGLHIALGLDWYGRKVTRGPVVYIYAEGKHGIGRRVEAWRLMNGLPEVGGIHFLPQSVLLNEPRDCRDLLATIGQLAAPPIAVIVDTLARTLKGNESAAEDMGAYIAACDQIKETTGATILLVHHTGWENTRSRGSSNLPGAIDTEITLTRDGDRVDIATTKQKDGVEQHIATLEAVTVAQSIGFRAFGPSSPKLSKNEHLCLSEVQASDGLTSGVWMKATGLAGSSFHNAKKRLTTLAYVRCGAGEKWCATEAGTAALGPKVQACPSGVQSPGSRVLQTLPPLIRGEFGLDLSERACTDGLGMLIERVCDVPALSA